MRTWKPLTVVDLNRIIADTEKDNPDGNHCDAQVYALACEVKVARKEKKSCRHACLAAIGFLAGSSILTKEQLQKLLVDTVKPFLHADDRE